MAEYVTNGTFATDIVGWTDNSTGAGSVAWSASDGGTMIFTNGSAPATSRGDQQIAATVSGVQYAVTFDIPSSSGNGTVEIGTSSGDNSLLSVVWNSSGSYEGTFVATGTTTWIGLQFTTDENGAYIDNVSVQEAYGGGYWQSQKGVARLTDPTLEMGDVEYRELIRAKANANNVDPTLANIYTYIVNAHDGITDCALKDPVVEGLVVDGDCEASGVDAWTVQTAGTFTKETTDPYEGTQNLKLAYLSTNNPALYQSILTVGVRYRIRCAVRTNGCDLRIKFGGGTTVWQDSSTDWVVVDEIATCDSSGILFLITIGCNGAGEYAEIDDITCERIFQAGDVELASNTGVVDVGIDDDELMHQGERNRLQVHGPRAGSTQLNPVNWTYEYMPFVQNLNNWDLWSINDATIDSKPSKILTCDTADWAHIPAHGHFVGEIDNDLAYGEWEWWIYKDAAGAPIVMFIAGEAAAPSGSTQDGYTVAISAAGILSLNEVTNGAATPLFATAAAAVSDDTWTKITVTRSAANVFTTYIDDVAATANSGSNPVTDATNTVSKYMVIDLDADDQIGLEHFEDDTKLFTYEPL